MSNKILSFTLLFIGAFIAFSTRLPEEGMFPLSEISKLDLKKAGLAIDRNEIYNPNGTSLVDALVNVGGCTGSFVSNQGLIITNHHCAFSSLQMASTTENDYLNKGFVAHKPEQEIEAKGLTCRITDSYEDVSDKVLGTVMQETDPNLRIQTIGNAMRNIALTAEKEDPSIKAEVSEMFIGKTYVLFRYKIIKDVRLVYVPNRTIGEFGGETDNWVWPRHTGDFSFMRAYVAKDGSTSTYSKDNIPYTPKKFLKVNASGTNEEDFVFMLGYPGKTYRHRPTQFIKYQYNHVLPYTSNLYTFENKVMEAAGKTNKATELKLANRIKRNANVLKNYNGKISTLQSTNLIAQKQLEDNKLVSYINDNLEVKEKYANLMDNIDLLYEQINSEASTNLWLSQIYPSTSLLQVAKSINQFKTNLIAQPNSQKEAYFVSKIEEVRKSLNTIYQSYDIDVDRKIFKKMLVDASSFSSNQKIVAVENIISKGANKEILIDRYINDAFGLSRLKDKNYVFDILLTSYKRLINYNDGLLQFDLEITKQLDATQAENDRKEGWLNKLMADYVDIKGLFLNKQFIPDANSTLRLTYGHVRGYQKPGDTIFMHPYTTIKGILEKGATNNPDFSYPHQIKALWEAKDFGPFIKTELNDVPVAFLYNMDSTGGNSGSPVMNANGELIGVNFDRTYQATINDYAWHESYSRSIGVDIRYILWVANKIDHADFLIKEMGINL